MLLGAFRPQATTEYQKVTNSERGSHGPAPTEGAEKRLGPATTFYETVALSFVIPTAGVMGLLPTEGDEKRFGPATTFNETIALSFVIPTGAKGSAVPLSPQQNFRKITKSPPQT